ncbi:hypothetical protein C8Q76DRAFT_798764 [Earliella scabrosa]|nr:hypothetical protein C8Q76DRAFT_798764 [Earliella scabrosa]
MDHVRPPYLSLARTSTFVIVPIQDYLHQLGFGLGRCVNSSWPQPVREMQERRQAFWSYRLAADEQWGGYAAGAIREPQSGPDQHASAVRGGEADLLVGADGVHSATRRCMYDNAHQKECTGTRPESEDTPVEKCTRCAASRPTWAGIYAYRFLIPTEKLYALNPHHTTATIGAILCYSGKGNHIITYQISGGKFLNFVLLSRVAGAEGSTYSGKWDVTVPREEVVSKLQGWEPEVQQMLECIDAPTRWAIHVVEDLPFAVFGNVALLGDAMHAMLPNFGAGGGQAIEDAYILGRLLADPRVSLTEVPAVLKIYERVRLPFANDVARRARDVGLMYEFNAPGYYDGESATPTERSDKDTVEKGGNVEGREREELDRLGDAIHRMWEWQWTENADAQWVQAEMALHDLLGDGQSTEA